MKSFTYKDEGAAVVYDRPDGSSVSATISSVNPGVSITVKYAVSASGPLKYETVTKDNWSRVTKFPRNSLFLVT